MASGTVFDEKDQDDLSKPMRGEHVEIFLFAQRLFHVLQCIHGVTHEAAIMSEATFTFRVDEALKDQFTAAAKSRDRTGAQLLRDFMRDFVKQQQEAAAHDVWFRRQVQVGLDAANAGDVVSAEEVEEEAAAWRAETQRKLAASKS